MRGILGVGAAMAAAIAPAAALACPQCATRAGAGPLQTVALGALLLLPFAAAGVVYRIIRGQLGRERAAAARRQGP